MYRKVLSVFLVITMLSALSVNSFALSQIDGYYVQDVTHGICRTIDGETMIIPALAYMEEEIQPMSTVVTDSTLIYSTSNPKSGTIRVVFRIPAGAEVTYSIDLIPNNHNTSIDSYNGTVSNTGTSVTTKTINVNVQFYADEYLISASYATGPDRDRTYHVDEGTQSSKHVTQVLTNKFVWDDEHIAEYNNWQDVRILLEYSVQGAVQLIGVATTIHTGQIEFWLSATLVAGSLFGNDEVAGTDERLIHIPIEGWGYRFRLTPVSNGYKKELLIYDDQGTLYDTIQMGTISTNAITPAFY